MKNELKRKKYKRILLKLSGEALQGDGDFGIDPKVLDRVALEINDLIKLEVQIGLVIGGGNLFRGSELSLAGLDRVTGDHMGMLATTMNALAMRDALERASIPTTAMSAIPMSGVVDRYDRRSAIRCLENGDVLIFSSGTGNPFFTTDSAASLRAIEINAELMIKATKVDGVYDDDPMTNENALKYDTLSYDDVLQKKLRVMDSTAICLCRDQNMPICVFKMEKPGALINIIEGKDEGTLIK
jgi:uridylate kinase